MRVPRGAAWLSSLAAVAAVAALAAGGASTWRQLGRAHSHLTRRESTVAAAKREHLPPALFAAWRARVHAGDRWWLEAPPGASVGLTNRRAVYLARATFELLPATPARSRRDATVFLRLRVVR